MWVALCLVATVAVIVVRGVGVAVPVVILGKRMVVWLVAYVRGLVVLLSLVVGGVLIVVVLSMVWLSIMRVMMILSRVHPVSFDCR